MEIYNSDTIVNNKLSLYLNFIAKMYDVLTIHKATAKLLFA